MKSQKYIEQNILNENKHAFTKNIVMLQLHCNDVICLKNISISDVKVIRLQF